MDQPPVEPGHPDHPGTSAGTPDPPELTLAAKLELLYDTYPAGSKRYSDRRVEAGITKLLGYRAVHHVTLNKIRKGQTTKPGIDTLQALSEYFGVPLQYWDTREDARLIAEQLKLLTQLRDAGAHVHLRTTTTLDLSAEDQQQAADRLLEATREEVSKRLSEPDG